MPRSLSWPQCLNQVLRWPAGRKEQRFLKLIHEINPFLFMTLCNTLQPEKSKVFDMSFDLVLWVALPPPSEWKQGVSQSSPLCWFHMPKMGIKWQKKSYPIHTLLKRKNYPAAKHWALISFRQIRRLSKSDKKYNKNKTKTCGLNTVFWKEEDKHNL